MYTTKEYVCVQKHYTVNPWYPWIWYQEAKLSTFPPRLSISFLLIASCKSKTMIALCDGQKNKGYGKTIDIGFDLSTISCICGWVGARNATPANAGGVSMHGYRTPQLIFLQLLFLKGHFRH